MLVVGVVTGVVVLVDVAGGAGAELEVVLTP